MRIVLLRHATRISQSFGDSPLSAAGLAQADDLALKVQPSGELPPPTELLASPKRRAQETLKPLANTTHLVVRVDARLDERAQGESGAVFESRVRSFVDEMNARALIEERQEECLYLCSHLDWLELAISLLPSDLSDFESSLPWSTAEFRVFRIDEGIWKLQSRGVVTSRL